MEHDAALVYDALQKGRGFVAYDGIGSAKSFHFSAWNGEREATMGEKLPIKAELMVSTPLSADVCLLRDGRRIAQARGKGLRFATEQTGTYRVEAYRRYWLRTRGWFFKRNTPYYIVPPHLNRKRLMAIIAISRFQ